MKIELPEKVNTIIRMLSEHGHEAYAVGGCVRDSLLSRTADDWDITTSASPYEVKALFRRTIDTGIAHGTVTVMMEREGFEVTTYRIDGEYEDGRHPKEVCFTKKLSEDLCRRDFTINAMAYNEQSGLVDLFGGAADLEAGRIRCVGDARERFDEDALRILRAFRFSAQLDFDIEPSTLAAARERAGNLTRISAERIRTEWNKLLLSEHPNRLLMAWEHGITAVVLPEFDDMMKTPQNNSNHLFCVGEHVMHTVELTGNRELQKDKIRKLLPEFPVEEVLCGTEFEKKEKQILRWAALLHDVAKPRVRIVGADGEDTFPEHAGASAVLAKEMLRRLKFDNETIGLVVRLVAAHNEHGYEKTEAGIRQLMYRLGPDLMELLWELQLSDVLAQSPALLLSKLEALAQVKKLHKTVRERGDCVSVRQLAINGSDLIEAGFCAGPKVGEVLEQLLFTVLQEPERNNREELLKRSKELKLQME